MCFKIFRSLAKPRQYVKELDGSCLGFSVEARCLSVPSGAVSLLLTFINPYGDWDNVGNGGMCHIIQH